MEIVQNKSSRLCFGGVSKLVTMSPRNMVARELYERLVKSFLDVIVLKELGNGNSICGHEIRALIEKRFHVLMSSGTVYSFLYSMERKGLIKGMLTGRKRVYRLTEKGKETLENISAFSDEIPLFIKSMLGR